MENIVSVDGETETNFPPCVALAHGSCVWVNKAFQTLFRAVLLSTQRVVSGISLCQDPEPQSSSGTQATNITSGATVHRSAIKVALPMSRHGAPCHDKCFDLICFDKLQQHPACIGTPNTTPPSQLDTGIYKSISARKQHL